MQLKLPAALLALIPCGLLHGYSFDIVKAPVALRNGDKREWRSFPADAARSLSLPFEAVANATEYSLVIRQRDVKDAGWTIRINGQRLGVLQDDERTMVRVLPIPPGTLKNRGNILEILPEKPRFPDDISIEEMGIEAMPVAALLSQAAVSIAVTPAMPLRITVADARGALVPFNKSNTQPHEAVRTGVVYTANGQTTIGLPPGDFQIFASRGFDYSAPSARVRLKAGDRRQVRLQIRREVNIPGYINCDTHVHTFELSKHGDASVDERVLTAAGEGLDLIVATEHNRPADYSAALKRLHLDSWTLSVPGNEVTTPIGHFNIFPVNLFTRQPDAREEDWSGLMGQLRSTQDVKVIIQNHPRDLHSGYRPFDPSRHLASTGENLNGRPVQANAMEVVNSGAMSSDPLQLVRDWMGLLTRGLSVAGIGSSDTHTVDFVPIGQGRTYVKIDDLKTSWRQDVPGVAEQIARGQTLVSYGLAAQIQLAGNSRRTKGGIRVPVNVTVWAPSWSGANEVTIYSNAQPVWRKTAPFAKNKARVSAELDLPAHDTALVAVATGPGVLLPFWEVRKPYQATSDEWNPIVFGVSSALWVDGDFDGVTTPPLAYARKLIARPPVDIPALVKTLAYYDSSVTLHSVNLLRSQGIDIRGTDVRFAFAAGAPIVREAYEQSLREWEWAARPAPRIAK